MESTNNNFAQWPSQNDFIDNFFANEWENGDIEPPESPIGSLIWSHSPTWETVPPPIRETCLESTEFSHQDTFATLPTYEESHFLFETENRNSADPFFNFDNYYLNSIEYEEQSDFLSQANLYLLPESEHFIQPPNLDDDQVVQNVDSLAGVQNRRSGQLRLGRDVSYGNRRSLRLIRKRINAMLKKENRKMKNFIIALHGEDRLNRLLEN